MTGMATAAMAATIRAVKLYFAGCFLMREILASTTVFGNRLRVRVWLTKVRVSYPPGKATGIYTPDGPANRGRSSFVLQSLCCNRFELHAFRAFRMANSDSCGLHRKRIGGCEQDHRSAPGVAGESRIQL